MADLDFGTAISPAQSGDKIFTVRPVLDAQGNPVSSTQGNLEVDDIKNYTVGATLEQMETNETNIATNAGNITAVNTALTTHKNDIANPHAVTKAQVGLGNADNTSDANKPVSTAQQEALDLKADKATTYTQTETDAKLALKANSSDVYTQAEIDAQQEAQNAAIEDKIDKTIPSEMNSLSVLDGNGNLKDSKIPLVSKNLFDKSTGIDGYFVNQYNGTLAENSSYFASDWIVIKSETQYYIYPSASTRIAFYDSNKNFISGEAFPSMPITSPVNSKYIRFSNYFNEVNSTQLEQSDVQTVYEDFELKIPTSKIKDYFGVDAVTLKKVQLGEIPFLKLGKNLWSEDLSVDGELLVYTTGDVLTGYSNSKTSGFIKVEADTNYVCNKEMQRVCIYDTNKTFISGLSTNPSETPLLIPSNGAYIRISFEIYKTNIQVEKGNSITAYEEFGIWLVEGIAERKLNSILESDVKAFLPDEICVTVGRTIELYNKQVLITTNIDNYSVVWTCDIGKNMKRKWTYTGIAGDVGEYSLTCTIYKDINTSIKTLSTTIKVVSNLATSKSLLTIGDSLTNNKYWLTELRTLSSNNITLVGTRGVTDLKHEGRSGFRAEDYLNPTEYTFEGEGIQPFWNSTLERFDWDYYKTQNSINPDIVQLYLGTNGITLDPNTNAGNIKQIVDYIRQDDANIHIYVVFTLYRGDQNGIGEQTDSDGYTSTNGQWKLEEDTKVFNLMEKLDELLSGYSNVYFVPISLTHDSEYNFGAVSTPVNPRASQVEYLPTEATHPQQQGYEQMADIMYSTISAHE